MPTGAWRTRDEDPTLFAACSQLRAQQPASRPLMLAVVLAAGRGTRLMPLTSDRSKAMMPIAGKPMVARVLAMLAEGGVDHAIIVLHPDDRELVSYLARSPWSGCSQLAFQEQRLGTVDAIECASRQIREREASEFVLASCDNIYPRGHVADLIARRREGELDAALTLLWTSREQATASAVVTLRDGFVTSIVEKPDVTEMPCADWRGRVLCAPSLYALTAHVLDHLGRVEASPRGEREFPDALRLLLAEGGRVGGQLVSHRLTLTEPRDLLALNRRLLRSDPACSTLEAEIPAGVTVVPPVRIEKGARLGSGCHVGPDAYLERGCRVGAKAVVRRSIILRGGSVEPGGVADGLVISRGGPAA